MGLGSGDQDEPVTSSLVVSAEAPQTGSWKAGVGPLQRQKSNPAFAYPELRGIKKDVWPGNGGWTGDTLREILF